MRAGRRTPADWHASRRAQAAVLVLVGAGCLAATIDGVGNLAAPVWSIAASGGQVERTIPGHGAAVDSRHLTDRERVHRTGRPAQHTSRQLPRVVPTLARVLGPTVLLSVSVIAADTDARAQWLAGPSRRKFLGRLLGERILLPRPEDAAAYSYTAADRAAIDEQFAGAIAGGPDTVREQLTALLDSTGADELMLTTQVYDHTDRCRSYELITELAR
ncbi:MAG TPA: hypothetical protein VH008_34075 [Pseudonocardia sp.]|nr:hypothetical protein [Pseudonocardia sp.]